MLVPAAVAFRKLHGNLRLDLRSSDQVADLATDAVSVLRGLLVQWAGVSVAASIAVDDELEGGRLLRVLPKWRLDDGWIYAVYPPGRCLSVRARAFVDFLKRTPVARG